MKWIEMVYCISKFSSYINSNIDLGDGFIQYKEFRDYFSDDLLTGEANAVELTALFNEINTNKSDSITIDELLAFFNRNSTMITKEEAQIFLGMVSGVGNDNSITLKGISFKVEL